MNKGTVIFLNGTSSAGKTSLSSALAQILDENYMYLSVDNAIAGVNDMLKNMYGSHITREEIQAIEHGEMIENSVISLFHHTIRAFSQIGKNVIVDHVLVDNNWLEQCVQLLHDTRTYFVGVRCPIDELERRERERGDRPIGLARAQFDIVHRNAIYDIEVNTDQHTTEECAQLIQDHILMNQPHALRSLAENLSRRMEI